jgi:hypothetical protein
MTKPKLTKKAAVKSGNAVGRPKHDYPTRSFSDRCQTRIYDEMKIWFKKKKAELEAIADIREAEQA